MQAKLSKILRNVVLGLAAAGGLLFGLVEIRQHRTFDAPYPELHASQDPALIERGRYLAYGLAHCVDCHADPAQPEVAGGDIPLSGGHEWKLPFGVVHSRNITPDRETGIGRYSDPELARILRHGVHADGRAVLPFMPFAELADDDLIALLSFLRAQKPVQHAVPPNELNLLGKIVLAFALEPSGPQHTPPQHLTPEPSADYGRYLANNVGNCIKCHTRIDMRTGQLTAAPFSGGVELESERTPGKLFISPNLTPDPNSGWIEHWTEETFVARMHGGPAYPDSPMPWRSFQNMTDGDARALYRYLRSLPAASGGPSPRDPGSVATVAAR
ncbi:MAG TPA: hypothetical protein VJV78_00190 [Polyangiales bacterium]|nr:hypothetical protein [Polyangiales bacterium]